MWMILSLLSAFFAGITAILSKCGIQKVNSSLATALRTVVVLLFSWMMVFAVGSQGELRQITPKTLLFLVLSGLCTGGSWLFYFRALQLGDVNKVAPIDKSSTVMSMLLAMLFLGETPNLPKIIGMVLIAAGTYLMLERKKAGQKGTDKRWILYAFLSALFAALTSIFGKVGIEGVESNLGTAIRTGVVLLLAWGIVFLQGTAMEIRLIDGKSWAFLVLSGVTTGASWLCYYGALHDPSALASVVVPIDKLSIVVTVVFSRIALKETLSKKAWCGLAVLVAGTLLLLL